ncbi:hypothetical protein BSP239C_02360 [Brevibacterium sp. 239c]|nr:hypothetical protein BSP239C_02360 [Brevibacterium sp. 239c]
MPELVTNLYSARPRIANDPNYRCRSKLKNSGVKGFPRALASKTQTARVAIHVVCQKYRSNLSCTQTNSKLNLEVNCHIARDITSYKQNMQPIKPGRSINRFEV